MKKTKYGLIALLALGTALVGCNQKTSTNKSEEKSESVTTTVQSTPTVETLNSVTISQENNKVVWQAIEGAKGYKVYVDDKQVTDTTETSYELSLTDKTGHNVKVVSYNDKLTAADSNVLAFVFPKVTEKTLDKASLDSWYNTGTVESIDPGVKLSGESTIKNVLEFSSADKYLTLIAGSRIHEKNASLKVSFGNTVLKPLGYDTEETVMANNAETLFAYTYDLTGVQNKTDILTIAQSSKESVDLVVNSLRIEETAKILAGEFNSFEKAEVEQEWTLAGNYRDGVGEGFDINSYDDGIKSSITKLFNITDENFVLKLDVRMFRNQDGGTGLANEEAANYAHLAVRANGISVKPFGFDSDYAKIPGYTDATSYVYYDLSAYKGKTINLSIANDNATGHCVLQRIELGKTLPATTNKTYYNKEAIASDWEIIGNYREGVGEGFDINSFDDGKISSIAKWVNVTAENSVMVLSMRTFGGQDQASPEVYVSVGDEEIKAIADSKAYFNLDHTDDVKSFTTKIYDLSKYNSKTIRIEIEQRNGNCGHGVVRSVSFAKFSPNISIFNKDNMESEWAIYGLYEKINEGINIDSWDGFGGMVKPFNLTNATATLTIKARSFVGQSDNGKIEVFVNETLVNPTEGNGILDSTTDDMQTFTYDLSAFTNNLVIIRIQSSDDNAHKCCFESITLSN